MDYMPPIETGQKQRTHYLAVHTETLETYCTFKQQALKIAPTANYELSATVHGNVTLVDNYKWQCFTGNDPYNTNEFEDTEGVAPPLDEVFWWFEVYGDHLEALSIE